MSQFKGILYGTGFPLAGANHSAKFTSVSLKIDNFDDINLNSLTVRVGGFDHNQLFFHWEAADKSKYSFQLASVIDVKMAIKHAPDLLTPHFTIWHKRRFSISTVWTAILSSIAIIAIASVLFWWKYDHVISWVASQVTIENEQKLGASIFEQMKADVDIVDHGPALETLRAIGGKLTTDSNYDYQWYLVKDTQINAYALPGGIIIVNTGLITAVEQADELAAVLAHEIQHVEQRHSLKSLINSLGWAAGMMILLGDVNISTAVIVHQLGNMYFSRDKENEADQLGVELLIAADINPSGMLRLMQRLEEVSNSDIPEWISSHPTTSDRIDRIKNLLAENPCASCKSLDYDWAKIANDETIAME
jgi:predicted Zn-dependent protease